MQRLEDAIAVEIEAAGLFAVAGDDLEAGLQVAEAAGFIIMEFERPQRDGVIGDDYECCLATVFARGKGSFANGGVGGIRTLGTAFQPYNGLANRRLQPLGHHSKGKKRRPIRALSRS